VFSNESQARTAWNAGLWDGATPDKFRSYGGTVGNGTGLGDNCASISAQGQWFGAWSKDSSYAVLQTNYGALTTMQVAKAVAGRM
jgi:hypothetical protein